MTDRSDSGGLSAAGVPIGALLAAGIAGEIVFEVLAFVAAPAVVGQTMQPALLVMALARTLLGLEIGLVLGWAGHLLAGVVLFPLGYVAFRRLTGLRKWWLAGLLWAVVLWLVAQGVLAPLVGRPVMLGFVPYTWASLAAHALYSLTVALVWSRLAPQR